MKDLIRLEKQGFFCPEGEFFIDAWGPVEKNLVTHAHADHARLGARHYLTAEKGEDLLRARLGASAEIEPIPFGQKKKLGSVWISFHSAGHMLGSAQIRVEKGSHVAVFSGDYKRASDLSCAPFEIIPCETFITETTFALPIYQWGEPARVFQEIIDWHRSNAEKKRASVLFCYALGKAQRILSSLAPYGLKRILLHGSIARYLPLYQKQGVAFPPTQSLLEAEGENLEEDLVLAPPSAHRSPWMRRFQRYKTALASGWMICHKERKRRGFDKGFILSDHVDWNDLLRTIRECGAKKILTMHGYAAEYSAYLQENEKLISYPLGRL